MQNKNVINIAILVIVAGGMFYGGMLYGMNKATSSAAQSRQGRGNGGGNNGADGGVGVGSGQRGQRGPNGMGDGGFSNGQIISKDDTSITIKTRDGSSKIVYYSGSTAVGKVDVGTASDLGVGENVMISGNSNADGSIAADNIQIRPSQPVGQSQGK